MRQRPFLVDVPVGNLVIKMIDASVIQARKLSAFGKKAIPQFDVLHPPVQTKCFVIGASAFKQASRDRKISSGTAQPMLVFWRDVELL